MGAFPAAVWEGFSSVLLNKRAGGIYHIASCILPLTGFLLGGKVGHFGTLHCLFTYDPLKEEDLEQISLVQFIPHH